MKPTEEWLIAINKKFSEENMPPIARTFRALEIFSKEFKCSVAIPSEAFSTISEWFYKNT